VYIMCLVVFVQVKRVKVKEDRKEEEISEGELKNSKDHGWWSSLRIVEMLVKLNQCLGLEDLKDNRTK